MRSVYMLANFSFISYISLYEILIYIIYILDHIFFTELSMYYVNTFEIFFPYSQ